MYFVSPARVLKPTNEKHIELCKYISQFECNLIKDELSLDAFKADIKRKIEELDAKYPRTTRLVFATYSNGVICCYPELKSDAIVFSIIAEKVKGIYEFSENNSIELSEKGGDI